MHSSPRILIADEQISEPVIPKRGIVAGRPMIASMIKILLRDIIAQLIDRNLPSSIRTWDDDLGIDIAGRSSKITTSRMMTYSKKSSEALEINGLQLAKDKSGFLNFSKEMKKEFKIQLAKILKEPPPIIDILKDLGMDAACARLRRLPTQKARVQKVRRRAFELGSFERSQR